MTDREELDRHGVCSAITTVHSADLSQNPAVREYCVKRLVREAFRRLKALFPKGLDLVFVAKHTAGKSELAEVSRELERLCRKLSG